MSLAERKRTLAKAGETELAGLGWDGDLDEMRQGRNFDHIK